MLLLDLVADRHSSNEIWCEQAETVRNDGAGPPARALGGELRDGAHDLADVEGLHERAGDVRLARARAGAHGRASDEELRASEQVRLPRFRRSGDGAVQHVGGNEKSELRHDHDLVEVLFRQNPIVVVFPLHQEAVEF